MKYIKTKLTIIMCLIFMAFSCVPVYAMTHIDLTKKTSLTINVTHNNVIIPDVNFKVYYLATTNSAAYFTLTDKFSGYSLEVNKQTTAGWKNLAQVIKGNVIADEIEADYLGTNGSNKTLVFSNLEPGLYFVMGEKKLYDGYTYTIDPTIVCLPNLINDIWVYDGTIVPKMTAVETPLTDIEVIKSWDDGSATSIRPSEITVKLYMDDTLFDTVTLNQSNNWRYIWHELPKLDLTNSIIEWSIVEEEVTNYTTNIDYHDNLFIITNKYNGTHHDDPPDIPYTGQLNWPIPILAFSGLMFLTIGSIISRKKNNE